MLLFFSRCSFGLNGLDFLVTARSHPLSIGAIIFQVAATLPIEVTADCLSDFLTACPTQHVVNKCLGQSRGFHSFPCISP